MAFFRGELALLRLSETVVRLGIVDVWPECHPVVIAGWQGLLMLRSSLNETLPR